MFRKDKLGLGLGLLCLILPMFIQISGLSYPGHLALGIFLMAAIFWITEPIPIYATSMLVILCQIFLLSSRSLFMTSQGVDLDGYTPVNYSVFMATLADPIIILFLGGFALASAAVKFDLDRNLTRILLKPFGSNPAYIALGLMLVTALLSAFMSNTATTAMMMTVVIPIAAKFDNADPFKKLITLCVPFSANIGGIATPIGTPPNAIALAALKHEGFNISFTTWMVCAAPLAIIMLFVTWRVLLFAFPPAVKKFDMIMEGQFQKQPKAMITYFIFGLTILLWVTESIHRIPSSMTAFIPVALLPALGVLDKSDIRNFGWEVLWLVAGGISLGLSMQNTGLANWVIELVPWAALGGVGLVLAFCIVAYLIANLVSHTVSASILVPIALGMGLSGVAGQDFNLATSVMMIAVVVSFSMMLPISTPPNAIAMSSGMIKTSDMSRTGAAVGVGGIFLLLLFGFLYWPLLIKP